LFTSASPWQRAASHVKAFELSIQFETETSEEKLIKVIEGLRSRHIPISLDILALDGRGTFVAPNGCGFHVEGYSAPGQALSVAKHFRALRANVAYVDMDEPLYYGHLFNGVNACHSSFKELLTDIANNVKQVRSQYPAVQVGESEPFSVFSELDPGDVEKWLDGIKSATGKPLAFMRLDMDWNAKWQPEVSKVARLLKRKGVRLQVIYNGLDGSKSDEEWISRALLNARDFEEVIRPDGVAIESWAAFPKTYLPETDPISMTGLINRYLAERKLKHHEP
jgi:hypothetical protein